MARRNKLTFAGDGAHYYEAAQQYRAAERRPCQFCGVRSDVGCRHQVAA